MLVTSLLLTYVIQTLLNSVRKFEDNYCSVTKFTAHRILKRHKLRKCLRLLTGCQMLDSLNIQIKFFRKKLSSTRWSARDDACQNLKESWDNNLFVLSSLKDDAPGKSSSRWEGTKSKLKRFETAFMVCFWSKILDRLNETSKTIQTNEIHGVDCYRAVCIPFWVILPLKETVFD